MKNELVEVRNGKVVCNSLMVAEKFGKRHDNILQSIENLECSQEFRLLNFQESSYANSQNKQMPMFEMTRDGFTFLAMGFTGKEAAEWKEKYINAFNTMESAIREGGRISGSKPKKTNEALEAAKLYKPFFQIARLIGCDKNAAAISANQACMRLRKRKDYFFFARYQTNKT